MKTGIEHIIEERQRQISIEGYTSDHDDKHTNAELARAGACYVIDYATPAHVGFAWPWDKRWWKPTPNDPIKQLAKAGALIAAEIDRLQSRTAPSVPKTNEVPMTPLLTKTQRERLEKCVETLNKLKDVLAHPKSCDL